MKTASTLAFRALTAFLLFPLSIAVAGPVAARFRHPNRPEVLFEPQWRRDFVRHVSPKVSVPLLSWGGVGCRDTLAMMSGARVPGIPEYYLQNQAAGGEHMYRWFLEKDSGSYEAALRKYHRLAALGPGGHRSYWASNSVIPYNSADASPGSFRVEVAKPLVSGEMFGLLPDEIELLKNFGYSLEDRIEPKGIVDPELQVPTVLYDRQTALCVYEFPKGDSEKAYRAAVFASAEKLRKRMALTADEAAKDAENIAKELAGFYYASVRWMPFDVINNSLLMGQVNIVLRHLGFQTMEHGRLDYLAMATPPEVFEKIFLRAFRAANLPK